MNRMHIFVNASSDAPRKLVPTLPKDIVKVKQSKVKWNNYLMLKQWHECLRVNLYIMYIQHLSIYLFWPMTRQLFITSLATADLFYYPRDIYMDNWSCSCQLEVLQFTVYSFLKKIGNNCLWTLTKEIQVLWSRQYTTIQCTQSKE